MIDESTKDKEPQKPLMTLAYTGGSGAIVFMVHLDVNKKKIQISDEDAILTLDSAAAHSLAMHLISLSRKLDRL